MDGDLLGCLSISVGPSGLAIKASSVRLSVRLASTSTLPQARKPCMPCHSCHAQDFTQELSAPITSNHLQQVMNIPAASAFNFPRLQKLCRFAACFVQIFSTSHGVQNGMLALVSSIVSIPETLCFSHLYMQYIIYHIRIYKNHAYSISHLYIYTWNAHQRFGSNTRVCYSSSSC
jgi:hypothetical protein